MWNALLDRALRRFVRQGRLTLITPDGRQRRFGPERASDTAADARQETLPDVTVTLRDAGLVRRLVLNPELALGEGYVEGGLEIAGDDLHGLLELAMRNLHADLPSGADADGRARPRTGARAGAARGMIRLMRLFRHARRMIDQFNPVGRARRNVAHHYDLSGALYALFLDEDRQYSCAYFRTPDDTLETAQAQKKAHIAAKLNLAPGMRVLDIGCGWGGMALSLARDHGARVLGITLSQEQLAVARERARAARLEGQVEFRLMDYRALEGQFDRIVSVGMFEHVGAPHFRSYFNTLRNHLKDDGAALLHTIGRSGPPGSTNPWIARYIFPGGYIPALSEISAAIEQARLVNCDTEVWRLHYALTLRHWFERFRANEDRARSLYDARFCRMWRFYLAASEQAFRHGGLCVFQFQLARDPLAVPITRDYLYRGQTEAAPRAAE